MKIAFVDPNSSGFSPRTPSERPLGGAQSCLAYLAPKLAALGHEVLLFTRAPDERSEMGVSLRPLDGSFLARFQAASPDIVVFNHFEQAFFEARDLLRVPIVLWFHSAPQFPDILARVFERRDGRTWFDRMVFVSQWQKDCVERLHPLPPGTGIAIANGVSDHFLELAADPAALAARKADPWRWAYTSTPFRGLDLLVETTDAVNGAGHRPVVDVYSSMAVYGADDRAYNGLYQKIGNTPGMRHHGSVEQAALAKALRDTAVLSYPSTYPETFCIAAAEAMAAGCKVVATALGALPETMGGLAELVPFSPDRPTLRQDYVKAIAETCQALSAETPERRLERITGQTAFVRARYNWAIIAHQWDAWLRTITAAGQARLR